MNVVYISRLNAVYFSTNLESTIQMCNVLSYRFYVAVNLLPHPVDSSWRCHAGWGSQHPKGRLVPCGSRLQLVVLPDDGDQGPHEALHSPQVQSMTPVSCYFHGSIFW